MSIPVNIKTPGTYIDVNINTQRAGLPANIHKILFVTTDPSPVIVDGPVHYDLPIDIYDTAQADEEFGANSVAGRMLRAAIQTNRLANVQALGGLDEEMMGGAE